MVRACDILNYLISEGFDCKSNINDEDIIGGFSSLNNYKSGTVTWIKNLDKLTDSLNSEYTLVISDSFYNNAPYSIISVPNAKRAFFMVIEHFWGEERSYESIGQYTYIGENVKIGKGVCIGNNCSISGDVTIGNNCHISDNVVIKNKVIIGNNCDIQGLVVIGEDGFGSFEENHIQTMIKHYGGVVIGNDVFIGSHTNIARGTIDDTVIGNGVKIAPSSHIGHNNVIDRNVTFICSQSYGSVHIKENAYIVGSIIRNQCTIGENSIVGMGSVVTKDVDSNVTVIGAPARVMKRNSSTV